MHISRKTVAFLISVLMLAPLAVHAILPIFPIAFLMTEVGGTTAALAWGVEISVWTHVALLALNWTKDSSELASTPPKPVTGAINVQIMPDKKRVNPDPKRYDDASGSDIDPKPKATYDSHQSRTASPTDFKVVVQNIGGAGTSAVMYSSVTQDVQYLSVDTAAWNVSLPCNQASSSTRIPDGYGYAWCGAVTVNGVSKTYAVYSKYFPADCVAGYSKDANGICTKTVPDSQILKPADTPCELVLRSSGVVDFDPQNPNCTAAMQAGVLVKPGDRKIKTITTDGTTTEVTYNTDGTTDVNTTKKDGSKQNVKLDKPDPGTGRAPVKSVGSTGPSSGGGGDTGGGSSGGSSGTGTGSCGGTGQVPCSIDDSGFKDKTLNIDPVKSKLDSAGTDFQNTVDQHTGNPHQIGHEGFFGDLRFGLPRVTCQNPDLNFGSSAANLDLSFDLCGNELIHLARQLEAWLLYVFTVYYVWRRFLTAEDVAPVTGA